MIFYDRDGKQYKLSLKDERIEIESDKFKGTLTAATLDELNGDNLQDDIIRNVSNGSGRIDIGSTSIYCTRVYDPYIFISDTELQKMYKAQVSLDRDSEAVIHSIKACIDGALAEGPNPTYYKVVDALDEYLLQNEEENTHIRQSQLLRNVIELGKQETIKNNGESFTIQSIPDTSMAVMQSDKGYSAQIYTGLLSDVLNSENFRDTLLDMTAQNKVVSIVIGNSLIEYMDGHLDIWETTSPDRLHDTPSVEIFIPEEYRKECLEKVVAEAILNEECSNSAYKGATKALEDFSKEHLECIKEVEEER